MKTLIVFAPRLVGKVYSITVLFFYQKVFPIFLLRAYQSAVPFHILFLWNELAETNNCNVPLLSAQPIYPNIHSAFLCSLPMPTSIRAPLLSLFSQPIFYLLSLHQSWLDKPFHFYLP